MFAVKSISKGDIISALSPGLKTGIYMEKEIFWSEIASGYGEAGGTPHQEFPGVPPWEVNAEVKIGI